MINLEYYFYGLDFCLTGKLERMTRKEANKAAALVGAVPEKGVTQCTNILVVEEQDWRIVGTDGLSNKMKKALAMEELHLDEKAWKQGLFQVCFFLLRVIILIIIVIFIAITQTYNYKNRLNPLIWLSLENKNSIYFCIV